MASPLSNRRARLVGTRSFGKGETDSRSETSLPCHLAAAGQEQSGSQSYVPPDEKNDKALRGAIDSYAGPPQLLA